MLNGTFNAQPAIFGNNKPGMLRGPVQSAPTTEVTPTVTETTAIPEKSSQNGPEETPAAILGAYDKIGKFDTKRLQVTTLESGIGVLDRHKFLTQGQGRLLTIGAHTSHGKSALMMQIAAHVAKTERVIVHSFEMGRDEIETRLLAAITNIPSTLITEGSLQKKKIDEARADYASRQLYVSNVQNRSLNYVLSSVLEMSKAIGGAGLVVIDYGQQVKPGGHGTRVTERVVEITDISAGLLQLAQQLKCNVLVGAQLNNEVLKRAYGSKDEDGNMSYLPIISDIREGSSIAHDSSAVLMVVRPHVFNRDSSKDTAHFYCVKNRHGELWDAQVKWDGPRCYFYEDAKGL